jgi:hypothetical protein
MIHFLSKQFCNADLTLKRLILFMVIVFTGTFIILPGTVFGQTTDLLELISDYRDALRSDDAATRYAAREALMANSSAMNYLMANDPDLYATLRHEDASEGSVLVGGNERTSYDIGRQAKDFPASSRRDNAQKVQDEPLRKQTDLKTIAENFPNQNRPSNQELIEQQLRQSRSWSGIDSMDGSVFVTISGVGDRERSALKRILEDEIAFIEKIDEVGYRAGLVEYRVQLNGITPEDFAYSLDNRRFGSLMIDMVRFQSERIDFILKF